MNNTQATIARVETLLQRKQAIPSGILRALLIDCKALLALSKQQAEDIARLKAEAQKAEGE